MVWSKTSGFLAFLALIFLGLFSRYAFSLEGFAWSSALLFVSILIVECCSFLETRKAAAFFTLSSVLMLLSVIYLYTLGQSLSYALVLLGLVHFIFSLRVGSCGSNEVCEESCESSKDASFVPKHSMIFPSSTASDTLLVSKDLEGKKTVPLETKISAGQKNVASKANVSVKPVKSNPLELAFVASKNGKYYHAKGSEWALKIKEANQKWFASQVEAQEAGYLPSKDLKQNA